MAIWGLARVRVDAFSKTMPRTRPGRVAARSRMLRSRRSSSARFSKRSISPSARSQKLRKWRGLLLGSTILQHSLQDLDRLVDLRFADDQRRHETHHVA